MQKVALIDIDNTLWDFASVLYEEIIKVNPLIPQPEDWHNWDFWKDYMDGKSFYSAVNSIHLKQDSFGVYPDATEFIRNLEKSGYKIIIATHREEQSRVSTVKWLIKHRLPFDELHICSDKTVLFCKCHIVVDDSPHVLQKAQNNGIMATGLEFPWNRGNGFSLFKNLSEILQHFKLLNLI